MKILSQLLAIVVVGATVLGQSGSALEIENSEISWFSIRLHFNKPPNPRHADKPYFLFQGLTPTPPEVAHCVKCAHPTNAEGTENAFTTHYTGNATTATFNAPGNRVFGFTQKPAVKCDLVGQTDGSQSFNLDPRTANFDTMGEIVNDINGRNKYTALLTNPPNKAAKHPFVIGYYLWHQPTVQWIPRDLTNKNIKNQYQVTALIDEYLMCARWGPSMLGLKFSKTWAKSIKAMDVKGHHGM